MTTCRPNWHEEAGQHLANLYSLIATCEANAVEPTTYLADVLMRLSTHPADRVDERLPHRWAQVLDGVKQQLLGGSGTRTEDLRFG